MFRTTVLAVAAFAALGVTALAPTAASAARVASHAPSHVSMPRGISHVSRLSITRGPHLKGPHLAKLAHLHDKHHHHDHDHHHCHNNHHCHPHIGWWWWKHHHPYWVVPATVEPTAVAPTATTPAAKDNCTCLTKTYLADGSVLFKDVCTKEMAVASPEELKAQAEGAPAQPAK